MRGRGFVLCLLLRLEDYRMARETEPTADWTEVVYALLADMSDFLGTYQDQIDNPMDTPAADLKARVDDLLS